ncbi:MAG: kynureninase/PvdN C-terminal domain-containing protein [Lacisediminihabitans sp.]
MELPRRIGDDLGRAALGAGPGQMAIGDSTTVLSLRWIPMSQDAGATPGQVSDAELASPRSAERRGSHVTLNHDGFAAIVPSLWQQGVIPDFRAPRGIRLGLSPLSTSFAEVELGVLAIREALDRFLGLMEQPVVVRDSIDDLIARGVLIAAREPLRHVDRPFTLPEGVTSIDLLDREDRF